MKFKKRRIKRETATQGETGEIGFGGRFVRRLDYGYDDDGHPFCCMFCIFSVGLYSGSQAGWLGRLRAGEQKRRK